ncbi:MAG: sigma-70 family RNA polymerase sigma factor [Bdellovibrionales bacterium]|nr:sigma-70 family RNA polymerase sigma factor [Bdellovibrionales bacterium]
MATKQAKAKRDKLIEEYREYVEQIVGKLISTLGLPTKHFEEHVAAGYLGLVEAAERYDSSMGTDFRRYAFFRIRGAIIDGIRDHSDLSTKAYYFTKALKATQDLREQDIALERSYDTASGLAQLLDYAAKGALAYRYSIEEVLEEVSQVEDENLNPEGALIRRNQSQQLLRALEVLDEKERDIIHAYYYRGKTFVQISEEENGLSKSWISRLHARALQKLQEHYQEQVSECA